jgi:hypothetical protein
VILSLLYIKINTIDQIISNLGSLLKDFAVKLQPAKKLVTGSRV